MGVGVVAEKEVLTLLVHDEYGELLLVMVTQLSQNTRQEFVSLGLSMRWLLLGGPRCRRFLMRVLDEIRHRSFLLRLNFSLFGGLLIARRLFILGGLLCLLKLGPSEDTRQVLHPLLGVVEYFGQPGIFPHLQLLRFLFGSHPLCETDADLPPTHAGLTVVLTAGPFPRLGSVVGDGHGGRFAIVIMQGGGGEGLHRHRPSLLLLFPLSPPSLVAFTGIVDDLEGLFGRAAAAAFGQPMLVGFFVTVAKHEW